MSRRQPGSRGGRTHTTRYGRVVYDRPKHVMTDKDRIRIAGKPMPSQAKDPLKEAVLQFLRYTRERSVSSEARKQGLKPIVVDYPWEEGEITDIFESLSAAIVFSGGDVYLFRVTAEL